MKRTSQISKHRIFAAVLTALLLLSAVSCAKIPVLTVNDDGLYENNRTDLCYIEAPGCYEARSYLSDTVVAQSDGVDFFAVEGVDGESWLWSPDFGILMYEENEKLPTLDELASSGMYVYVNENDSMRAIFDEASQSKVDEILDAYENGTEIPYLGAVSSYKFYLKFYSDTCPWILYNILFIQYEEDYIVYTKDEDGNTVETNCGRNFLYNRDEGRFVAIGDELQEYIDEYYHSVVTE